MPYAKDDVVSQSPLAGGIEIAAAEYRQSIEHMKSGGFVKVWAGNLVLTTKPQDQEGYYPAVWQDGEWVFEPIPEPDPLPIEEQREKASLSRADFKIGLLDMGELQRVKDFIAQTGDERIAILWEDSDRFERLNPDLLRLADELNYTDEQLDELFGIA